MLHKLTPAKGSIKKNVRRGRGQGSGGGGTAKRGHKGQKSRSGYSKKVGFEGGQMPLQRRVPKFGFTNPNRVVYKGINIDTLQKLFDDKKIKTKVDLDSLVKNGLAKNKDKVKILGRGELTAKLNVIAHKFSVTATKEIEKKGGTVTEIVIKK